MELKKCEKCGKKTNTDFLNDDAICLSCKGGYIEENQKSGITRCKECKEKYYNEFIKNGLCPKCRKKIKKLQESYKYCKFCGEKIKYLAIKCRFCNEMLENINNDKINSPTKEIKEIKTHKQSTEKKIERNEIEGENSGIANVAFILGILCIFFYTIGILTWIALGVSIVAMVKRKTMDKKHSMFTIAGFILSIIYFFMYLNAYGHI